jgi:hypothetical protein
MSAAAPPTPRQAPGGRGKPKGGLEVARDTTMHASES